MIGDEAREALGVALGGVWISLGLLAWFVGSLRTKVRKLEEQVKRLSAGGKPGWPPQPRG